MSYTVLSNIILRSSDILIGTIHRKVGHMSGGKPNSTGDSLDFWPTPASILAGYAFLISWRFLPQT